MVNIYTISLKFDVYKIIMLLIVKYTTNQLKPG